MSRSHSVSLSVVLFLSYYYDWVEKLWAKSLIFVFFKIILSCPPGNIWCLLDKVSLVKDLMVKSYQEKQYDKINFDKRILKTLLPTSYLTTTNNLTVSIHVLRASSNSNSSFKIAFQFKLSWILLKSQNPGTQIL